MKYIYILGCLLFSILAQAQVKLTLINKTGTSISDVTVKGKSAGTILPGESAILTLGTIELLQGAPYFNLSLTTEDGREVATHKESLGMAYTRITHGGSYKATITFAPNGSLEVSAPGSIPWCGNDKRLHSSVAN